MQTIDTYNFKGKRALVRVDFNVPMNESAEITDDTRIRAAIPTLKKVLHGGGSLVIMSHLGRPKGPSEKLSLKHLVPDLAKKLGTPVQFAPDCMGVEAVERSKNLQPGEVLLLENLRFYEEEEGKPRNLPESPTDEQKKAAKAAVKEKQKAFVKQLASYGDCYINDAFGTAHRAHASTALIAACFPNDKLFGYVMNGEIMAVDKVLENPERPFTAILGGSKVSTKITIIKQLLQRVNNLIIGGGMSFTFVKAQGGHIGKSICEDDQQVLALDILKEAQELGVTIYLPKKVRIAEAASADASTQVCPIDNIPDGWEGLDTASAVEDWKDVILQSKTILWNGPVGMFEVTPFAAGTQAVAQLIADATTQGAYSLVGGGDSVAAVNQMGFADKVSYVSTGGGALLEYIEGIELPGIKAIRE
ncbi:MAG: phosphoglycerate kinase [Prevotellaceae bacterium]|jgi:phosphoglycerate kinase|nr:phosphoglycerate kinase [Prevotellaceae bacterium]